MGRGLLPRPFSLPGQRADQWETLGTYTSGSAYFADANSNNALGFPGHFTGATNGNGTWVQPSLDA